MFYAVELFYKDSSLGKLWIAGTFFSKLSRREILSANVAKLCKDIKNPPVALALRAQSTLLFGVCKIENKQAYFLLNEAINARSKVLLAHRAPSKASLPKNKLIARPGAINQADVEDQEFLEAEIEDMQQIMVEDLFGMDLGTLDLETQARMYESQLQIPEGTAAESELVGLTPSTVRGIESRRGLSMQLDQELGLGLDLEDLGGPLLPRSRRPSDEMMDIDFDFQLPEMQPELKPPSPALSAIYGLPSGDEVSPVLGADLLASAGLPEGLGPLDLEQVPVELQQVPQPEPAAVPPRRPPRRRLHEQADEEIELSVIISLCCWLL